MRTPFVDTSKNRSMLRNIPRLATRCTSLPFVGPARCALLLEIQQGTAFDGGCLSLEPRQTVPDRTYPRRLRFGVQTPQRKRFRRLEIAIAVLVMDGERLGRLAHHARGAARRVDQTSP